MNPVHPNVENLHSGTTPQVREGFRIFGKIATAVAAVAAAAFTAFAAVTLFPQVTFVVAAISTLSLAAKIAILVGSAAATALTLWGMERLGRESALDVPLARSAAAEAEAEAAEAAAVAARARADLV